MIHAAFVVMSVSALAQGAGDGKPMSNQEYETQWKTVERMVRQEEFRKAHDMTMPLFERAEKEGNSRQMLTAAWLLGKIEAAYLDSSDYLFYNRMKHLMPLLDAPDKAVAQMLVGRFLLGSRNYWNKNENTDVDEEDYRLWSNERLKAEADKYIDEIVAAHEALGKVPSTDYSRFMQDTSSRTRRFTPTLLDVVVYTIIEDVDESSLDRNLQLLSLLRELHRNDGDEFKLFVDYKEYNLRARQMTVEAHLALVDEYLRQWRNSTLPDVAFFYLTKAHFHGAHKDYLEQDKCYDTIIERYPTSEFCNEARKEKEGIRWKNIVTAKMNHNQMTLRPMMASVQVRNIDTLYCRIVEQSSKVKTSANRTVLMSAKPLKEWSQPLPHRDDFQSQTVYLYLPPMPAGEYLLLISGNADFRPDKTELYSSDGSAINPKNFAQFRMAEFTCCDAAFLTFDNMLSNHYGGRLVNRATGEAIARHQVVLYNSANKANRKKLATTKTDAEGYGGC